MIDPLLIRLVVRKLGQQKTQTCYDALCFHDRLWVLATCAAMELSSASLTWSRGGFAHQSGSPHTTKSKGSTIWHIFLWPSEFIRGVNVGTGGTTGAAAAAATATCASSPLFLGIPVVNEHQSYYLCCWTHMNIWVVVNIEKNLQQIQKQLCNVTTKCRMNWIGLSICIIIIRIRNSPRSCTRCEYICRRIGNFHVQVSFVNCPDMWKWSSFLIYQYIIFVRQ